MDSVHFLSLKVKLPFDPDTGEAVMCKRACPGTAYIGWELKSGRTDHLGLVPSQL